MDYSIRPKATPLTEEQRAAFTAARAIREVRVLATAARANTTLHEKGNIMLSKFSARMLAGKHGCKEYEAASPEAALDAMALDAGYSCYDDVPVEPGRGLPLPGSSPSKRRAPTRARGAVVSRLVTVEVCEVGQRFGCCAVIRDALSRRKLATTRVCPYGFAGAARGDAEALCDDRGWNYLDSEESRA